MATCPACEGVGEQYWTPLNGGFDPQTVEEVECDRCHGDGTVTDRQAAIIDRFPRATPEPSRRRWWHPPEDHL